MSIQSHQNMLYTQYLGIIVIMKIKIMMTTWLAADFAYSFL